ncbi:MAG: carboxymuconolactone decarboxylase family protein [Rhodocyclaceae bacterium]|nr:MAG: carboxymuconolactone decarboxylase family protein [Rhodocyclaceae bacterium]
MKTIAVPVYEEVSSDNQAIFDKLKASLGFVPNLYATFAHSDTALGNYVALQNGKTSLSPKAKEVINLVVSQSNNCAYCLAAHTVVGKMQGFSDAQILEIRRGRANFDPCLDALARLVHNMAQQRSMADPSLVQAFFAAGWTEGNLVDVILVIGAKTIANYLHGATQVPVDFPPAPTLTS